MVVLGGGAVLFSRDAQVFMIGPIERMMTLVKKLAENPLESAAAEAGGLLEDEQDVREQGYETALLEQVGDGRAPHALARLHTHNNSRAFLADARARGPAATDWLRRCGRRRSGRWRRPSS